MIFGRFFCLFLWGVVLSIAAPVFAAPSSLWLEELTWPEIAAAQKEGYHAVLIPTGGTEQNAAHMALGKHNAIMHYTAAEIAKRVGHTLVAPVITYVPEGDITPPTGHMRFPGTLSLREETFMAVLEDTARSLKQHGFTRIIFIGDSGGNQAGQAAVAEKLSAEWKEAGVRVVHIGDYYRHDAQDEFLRKKGMSDSEIGTHAGVEDTAELLASAPRMVRGNVQAKTDAAVNAAKGGSGDARKATAALGKELLEMRVQAGVAAIHQLR